MKLLKATEKWHQQTKDAVEKNKVELYSKITIEGHILEIIEQIVDAEKESKKELSWRFMTLKKERKLTGSSCVHLGSRNLWQTHWYQSVR